MPKRLPEERRKTHSKLHGYPLLCTSVNQEVVQYALGTFYKGDILILDFGIFMTLLRDAAVTVPSKVSTEASDNGSH